MLNQGELVADGPPAQALSEDVIARVWGVVATWLGEPGGMALALPHPGPGARVLVGGLGMGYTVRGALALLPADGEVVVSELIPEEIGRAHV